MILVPAERDEWRALERREGKERGGRDSTEVRRANGGIPSRNRGAMRGELELDWTGLLDRHRCDTRNDESGNSTVTGPLAGAVERGGGRSLDALR
ncbi:uncharacterized protein RCC_05101 [Ramularia collo-cygni]|uniref:Uncharacterized protein n=1 Tax=Ramularia collo-cygni TaxID=112498 RepID=A0A2D3UY26_9PEZI|nr:uncharacterized protein RCC_05101 [Ramularia collo-cygni]CZT19255.1 uncharacterized protein RCC_05101 [Ramularia collo-cygni]